LGETTEGRAEKTAATSQRWRAHHSGAKNGKERKELGEQSMGQKLTRTYKRRISNTFEKSTGGGIGEEGPRNQIAGSKRQESDRELAALQGRTTHATWGQKILVQSDKKSTTRAPLRREGISPEKRDQRTRENSSFGEEKVRSFRKLQERLRKKGRHSQNKKDQKKKIEKKAIRNMQGSLSPQRFIIIQSKFICPPWKTVKKMPAS